MKKLIVFDLVGTLAESKLSLDAEMATLLSALLGVAKVAVISGGNWQQFKEQLLANLPHDKHLKHLSLLLIACLDGAQPTKPPGETRP